MFIYPVLLWLKVNPDKERVKLQGECCCCCILVLYHLQIKYYPWQFDVMSDSLTGLLLIRCFFLSLCLLFHFITFLLIILIHFWWGERALIEGTDPKYIVQHIACTHCVSKAATHTLHDYKNRSFNISFSHKGIAMISVLLHELYFF